RADVRGELKINSGGVVLDKTRKEGFVKERDDAAQVDGEFLLGLFDGEAANGGDGGEFVGRLRDGKARDEGETKCEKCQPKTSGFRFCESGTVFAKSQGQWRCFCLRAGRVSNAEWIKIG